MPNRLNFISTTGQYTKGNVIPYNILGSTGMSYAADGGWVITGNIRLSSAAGAGATSNISSAQSGGLLSDLRMLTSAGVATSLLLNIRSTGGTVPNNTLQKMIISAPEGNDGTNFWGGVTEYSMVNKTPLSFGSGICSFSWTLSNTSLPWQGRQTGAGNTSDVKVILCY